MFELAVYTTVSVGYCLLDLYTTTFSVRYCLLNCIQQQTRLDTVCWAVYYNSLCWILLLDLYTIQQTRLDTVCWAVYYNRLCCILFIELVCSIQPFSTICNS